MLEKASAYPPEDHQPQQDNDRETTELLVNTGLLVIGCIFFLATASRLWSIPLPRKIVGSLLVSVALAGSFAGFTVMVIEVAFEQDSKLAWFTVLALRVIAVMALLAGVEGLNHEARQAVWSRENLEVLDKDDEPFTAATLM